MVDSALPLLATLDDLARLVQGRPDLFVRWSRGPEVDLPGQGSRDDLTGVPMPGLSANPLAVEQWWGDRSVHLWVARRLYDYSHLEHEKGPGVHPWVFKGEGVGRGPDNEPLVRCGRPVCRLSAGGIEEAVAMVNGQRRPWGTMRRA